MIKFTHLEVHNSVFFITFRVDQPSLLSNFKTLHHTKNTITSHSPFLPNPFYFHLLQPETTTNLIFISVELPVLDFSYRWKHIICGFLWLASFTNIILSRFINFVAHYQYFIPFHCQIIFHCMDMSHVYPFISCWTFRMLLLFHY